MKKWRATSHGKALIAIGAPIAAALVFIFHLSKLGLPAYATLIGTDWEFAASQILGIIAFGFWIWRYTIPSAKFLTAVGDLQE